MSKVIPRDTRVTEGITERGSWRMWNCDVLEALRWEPDNWFHCCVTSPPYWRKRDYGVEGQLGQEKTLDEHIANLMEVFREVKRVLRPDGVFWMNYQDGYAQNGKYADDEEFTADRNRSIREGYPTDAYAAGSAWQRAANTAKGAGLAVKQLLLIPERLALALQADGWWMRARVIWHKPNAKPESAGDRPSVYHEDILCLTKSPKNFYDRYAARDNRPGESWGRQVGTVWSINTEGCDFEHTATFPAEIPRRCIQLSSSEATDKDGKAILPLYEPVVDLNWKRSCGGDLNGKYEGKARKDYSKTGAQSPGDVKRNILESMLPRRKVGMSSEPYGTCRILDPFAGVATTGLEALKLGRSFTGIELSESSHAIAVQRLRAFEQGLTYKDLGNQQLSLLEDAWN